VELAVDVDEDVAVAWIVRMAVGALCHLHVLAWLAARAKVVAFVSTDPDTRRPDH
jgi:hypothetical protein